MKSITTALWLVFIAVHCTASTQYEIYLPELLTNRPQYDDCPTNFIASSDAFAIDLSQSVDESLLIDAKKHGIQIIIRYYDWEAVGERWDDSVSSAEKCISPSSSPFDHVFQKQWREGKSSDQTTLSESERDLILAMGMSIGVVFQHCSDIDQSFIDSGRAIYDANRALELAKKLAQPKGTLIFFIVDFDVLPDKVDIVKSYVEKIKNIVEYNGYVAGIYGSGYICDQLAGIVRYCWLSQSTGHFQSAAFAKKNGWDLKQCQPRSPFPGSRAEFDLNIINRNRPTIPFWRAGPTSVK